MTRRLFLACLVAGLVVSMAMDPAAARRGGRSDRDDDNDYRRRDRNEHRESRRDEEDSLDEAVARVRRETGGRVLSAEKRGRRGDTTYRIKVLLPNGSVRFFDVAPRREKD
ncbi:MAG TPA: PepSY domain-containing protein [Sulfuricaulis sp.]|nr:PepSY domain-containing protein [Sulfuricaulis sp.]